MRIKNYIFFAVFMAISFVANATTYYVRATGDDTNAGTSSETALLTVSKALDKATSDGDIIDISGTVNFYNETPVAKVISKNIIMQGDNKSTAIILGLLSGAENISPIRIGTASGDVVVAAPIVTIQNLTFKDFDSAAETGAGVTGGVINFILGNFTCMNVNFENNTAYYGGAISVRNYIKDNAASSVVLIQDCYFYNNRALKTTTAPYSNGGAVSVYAVASTALNTFDVTIDRCAFESNTAEYSGSALRCRIDAAPNAYNKILVRNSTFVDNINKNGGVNSNISANQAAVYVEQTAAGARYGEVKFINNTIAYNKTEKTSGIAGFLSDFCPIVTVINNIFYSNYNSAATPMNYSYRSQATIVESRNNITNGHYEGLNNATAYSDNILTVTAEQLKLATREDLADNGGETKTLSLGSGSIAINGGYLTGAPVVDQRGATRVGTPDVGAYESLGIFSSVENTPTDLNLFIKIVKNGIAADKECDVQVFSVEGRKIRQEKMFNGQILPLQSGIYVINAVLNNRRYIQKVIL